MHAGPGDGANLTVEDLQELVAVKDNQVSGRGAGQDGVFAQRQAQRARHASSTLTPVASLDILNQAHPAHQLAISTMMSP